MKKTITIGIAGILTLLTMVVASAMYAGECLEVDLSELESLDNVVYDVVGNSSNLNGMNMTLNETTKNVSICFAVNYKPDSFTIIFIDNSTKEIITPVYIGGGGGGGGIYTRDVYRNVTEYVYRNITDYIERNETTDTPEYDTYPYSPRNWISMIIIAVVMLVGGMMLKTIIDRKSKKKEKDEQARTKESI